MSEHAPFPELQHSCYRCALAPNCSSGASVWTPCAGLALSSVLGVKAQQRTRKIRRRLALVGNLNLGHKSKKAAETLSSILQPVGELSLSLVCAVAALIRCEMLSRQVESLRKSGSVCVVVGLVVLVCIAFSVFHLWLKFQQLKTEHDRLTDRTECMQQTTERLQEESNGLNEEVNYLKSETQALKERTTALNEEIKDLRVDADKKSSEVSDLKGAVYDLEASIVADRVETENFKAAVMEKLDEMSDQMELKQPQQGGGPERRCDFPSTSTERYSGAE